MATIHSSMKHDMETAKNGLFKPENEFADKPENIGAAFADISSEKVLPAEEEKLMLEPAEESADAIADNYIGNISYKMLKDNKKKSLLAEEVSGKGAADAPENGYSADDPIAAEKERKREETEKIFSYMEEIENKIPAKSDGAEKSGSFHGDAASVKKEIAARLGKKGVAGIVLAAVLLLGGTSYILWSRKMSEEAAMNRDALSGNDLPPVSADVSKIADSNDAERISDLTALANIAALYHIEYGADLPVSRSYIKLNEANPVTEFLQDALGRYGKSEDLMRDPRHPDFYYAYRSADGNSVEFTARMEDPASGSCKDEDICIYSKILAEEDIDNISEHIERYRP